MAPRIHSILALCALLAVGRVGAVADPAPLALSLHQSRLTPAVGDIAFPKTSLLSLSLQGLRLSLSRDGSGNPLGRAWWITGVGTEHDTVFSGLTWRRELADGSSLALGFLKTGIDTARADDAQTLAVGSVGLPSYMAWMPNLALEYAFASNNSGHSGVATGLHLRGQIAALDYGLRLTSASSGFSPLGTALTPGRVASQISLRYPLPGLYQVAIDVSSTRASDRASPLSAQVYHATLSGPAPAFLPGLDGLRLDASYQGQQAAKFRRTWTLALAGGGFELRDWDMSTEFTWQSRAVGGSRLVRYGWHLRGDRRVNINAAVAALGYQVALRTVPGIPDAWGLSAGVNLEADAAPGGWAVSLDYHQTVAAPRLFGSGGRSVMLNIVFNGGPATASSSYWVARSHSVASPSRRLFSP